MDLGSSFVEWTNRRKRRKLSKATVASFALHGALITFILFMTAHAAQRVHAEQKPMRAFLLGGAAPPPPPPPPPPPASSASQPMQTPKVEVKPLQVQPHFVQPLEIPKEIPKVVEMPVTPTEDVKPSENTSTAPASQEGGQPGGVVGGVAGGVVGGVVGGTVGGQLGGELGGVKGGEVGGQVGATGTGTEGSEPNGPLRVGGDVKAPVVTQRVQPKYTDTARNARVTGVVIVEAVINKNGEVEQVKVVKPLPMGLAQEAEAAVRQWKFKPGTLNGQPVDVIFNLTVNFTLEGSK
jgi:protein TonB